MRGGERVRHAVYNIPEFVHSGSVLNLDVKFKAQTFAKDALRPALTATRFQTGMVVIHVNQHCCFTDDEILYILYCVCSD